MSLVCVLPQAEQVRVETPFSVQVGAVVWTYAPKLWSSFSMSSVFVSVQPELVHL